MMKLLRVLDGPSTILVYDLHNQMMLKELVESEHSVTELAAKLKIPTVTLWKRMQKLLAAGLVELSTVKKSGNLEKKLYRATAARFVPAELLNFKPKDHNLLEASEIYSQIQKMGMTLLTQTYEIPSDADPFDYALYANLRTLVQVSRMPDFERRIAELDEKLSGYKPRDV
jgi:predicted ArsR family transcriptional regulator